MQCLISAKGYTNVLEKAAIIAVWKPYSRAQMRYVRQEMIKTIVSNNLVDGLEEAVPV
jgi:hypothetical protein